MKSKLSMSAKIIGTGSYAPEKILTNEEIENMVPGVDANWTYETLGIKERRVADDNQSTADLALEAGKRAIENSQLTPEDIDLIILGTTTPRRQAPSTATFVQHKLGTKNCPAFDLAAVCSGFVYGVSVGLQFIASGAYKNVLVIGADTFSKITDWKRRDCVFFGDGAGAVVLGPSPSNEGIQSFDLGANGYQEFAWTIPAGGSERPASQETLFERLHYWQMDGKAVYQMATNEIPNTLSRSLEKANIEIKDIDHVIPHQPGIGVLKKTAEKMNIPFSKFHTNMERYANTSAATIPLLLDEVNAAGKLKKDETIAFVAVGAGWTWGSMILKWN